MHGHSQHSLTAHEEILRMSETKGDVNLDLLSLLNYGTLGTSSSLSFSCCSLSTKKKKTQNKKKKRRKKNHIADTRIFGIMTYSDSS